MSLLRSFRFRIALLATCLSGVVLVAFGAYAWLAVERISLERIDDQVRDLAERQLMHPPDAPYWDRVEEAMAMLFPEGEDAYLLLVKGPGGELLYQSPNWPVDLSSDRFPTPPRRDGEGPPPPGAFGNQRGPRGRGFNLGPPGRGMGRGMGRGGPPPFVDAELHERFTWNDGSTGWRFAVLTAPGATAALGLNLDRSNVQSTQVRNAFLLGLPLGLLLVGIAGFILAQRALRPVRVLAARMEQVTAQGLNERITLTAEAEEFQRLVTVVNGMLERLEKSFNQATRFSADAAHELKTPLTILQGELERGIQQADTGSAEQERYSRLLEEVQRVKSITRKLLLLSMADAGKLRVKRRPIDFTQLIEDVCGDIEVLAPQLRLEKTLARNVHIAADPDLIRQVVQNLANNAIKYNAPEGHIGVHLRQKNGELKLTFANTGNTIPEEERDRIFERFYRIDQSRNRASAGVGLGLSLAREIARAHGGELVLEAAKDKQVTAFTLRLPAGE
jgi:signal transduction histidine kinase